MIFPVFAIAARSQQKILETIVIGGGLMGSAPAWHLSNSGQKVTLIEQQDSIYTFGSSFGEARIARSLGPEKDIFSYLHNRSVLETEKLIDFLNKKEGKDSHSMEDIYTTSPVTYIYSKSFKNTVEHLIKNQKDPFEYAASAEEASEKFEMSAPDSTMILREYKKHSGTLNPKALIKKLHTGIKHHGNEIWYHQRITGLKKKGDLYEVELNDTKSKTSQTIYCKKVVSAAGPYTGSLLKNITPQFDDLITPKRVYLVFLKIDPKKYDSLSQKEKQKILNFYPVADFSSDLMFSMIEKVDSDRVPIIKIGGHLIREEIQNLDRVWEIELSDGEKEWGLNTTLNYLQKLNLPVQRDDLIYLDGYSCVYSLTKSEVPLVTYSLDEKNEPDPNFIVLGGMSGVGAKGSMAYGLIGANLLLHQEEESEMYQQTKKTLGVDRLLRELGKNTADSAEEDEGLTSWFISDQ